MPLYYFDASALVKYYVLEPGSTWIRSLVDVSSSPASSSGNVIAIAEIGQVEAAAAFATLRRTGRLSLKAQRAVYGALFAATAVSRYQVMPLTSADLVRAANLTQTYPLKAYDAVELAMALRLRDIVDEQLVSVIFVSGDRTQLAAAQSEGLATDNPFDHALPHETPAFKS